MFFFKNNKILNYFLIGIVLVAIVPAIIIRLVSLSVFDIYELKDTEAYRTIGVNENNVLRGSIYDRNMEVLAESSTAYNLIFNPYEITELKNIEINERNAIETQIIEEKAKRLGTIISSYFDGYNTAEIYNTIIKKSKNKNKQQYYCVIRNLSEDDKDKIIKQIDIYNNEVRQLYSSDEAKKNEYDEYALITQNYEYYFEDSQKRYYPHGSTGAAVLGYTDDYHKAYYGIEGYYDKELNGISDRRLTGRGASTIITALFNKTYKGVDSVNLVSTIDINIQEYLENAIYNAAAKTKADDIYGVVMNTKTGEILAMANTPGYNPENPNADLGIVESIIKENEEETTLETDEAAEEVTVPVTEEETQPGEEEETGPSATDLFANRVKTKAVTEYFTPGSVYKVFLVAGAVEENIEFSYNCNGKEEVSNSDDGYGNNRIITCALGHSHGLIGYEGLLQNSCNCASARLAYSILKEDLYYKYYEGFGFTEATGIDLPGGNEKPSESVYHKPLSKGGKGINNADLATGAFGQSISITSVQMAVAMSAIGNGGKILTPYLVSEQLDSNGNVVSKTEPVVKRQVISKETSDTMIKYLSNVISHYDAWTLDKYTVAGKTGTAQILDANEKTIGYRASFAAFGPIQDPEITVVINIMNPKREDEGSYDEILASSIAVPVAQEVFEKTLTYLGIPYESPAEE